MKLNRFPSSMVFGVTLYSRTQVKFTLYTREHSTISLNTIFKSPNFKKTKNQSMFSNMSFVPVGTSLYFMSYVILNFIYKRNIRLSIIRKNPEKVIISILVCGARCSQKYFCVFSVTKIQKLFIISKILTLKPQRKIAKNVQDIQPELNILKYKTLPLE